MIPPKDRGPETIARWQTVIETLILTAALQLVVLPALAAAATRWPA